MAYEQTDINDIRPEGEQKPSMIQRILIALFPRQVAVAIYCFGVQIAALFMKIGLLLWLPVKAVQFWREEWAKNNKKITKTK